MCKKLFITLSAALALGCAAGSQANTPFDDVADSGARFELIVRNQHGGVSRMSMFARWERGTRQYIGDVGAGQTETFTIPIGGQEGFWLEHGRGGARHADPTEYVLVQPGDRLEWTIWSESEVFYRRLPPR